MITSESEMLAAIRLVVSALESIHVPYLIGGSVASGVYGEPRATRDVDLVAALRTGHAGAFAAALGTGFYAHQPAIDEAITSRRCFNVIHLDTMVKVDVFVAKEDDFTRSQFARRSRKQIGQGSPLDACFASAEDTVLTKLDWYRQGGGVSDRQWNDVLGVLKVQGPALDLAYLKEWAHRLGLTDLLQQALDDAGLV